MHEIWTINVPITLSCMVPKRLYLTMNLSLIWLQKWKHHSCKIYLSSNNSCSLCLPSTPTSVPFSGGTIPPVDPVAGTAFVVDVDPVLDFEGVEVGSVVEDEASCSDSSSRSVWKGFSMKTGISVLVVMPLTPSSPVTEKVSWSPN